jgi:hypothetical protein
VNELPFKCSANPWSVPESSVGDKGFRSFRILLCSANHFLYRSQSIFGYLIAGNPRISISLTEFLSDGLTFVTDCVTPHYFADCLRLFAQYAFIRFD